MSDLVAGPRTARWTATSTEGVYRFQVTRADDIPVDADRRAWHWHLQFWPADGGQEIHVMSTIADVIWAPTSHDSVRVLASLSVFLSAWDDAVRYDGSDGENRGLFPDATVPVLGAVDEFTVDMYIAEMLGISTEMILGNATGNSEAQSAQ
jgi:hypothetical protein